MKKTIHKKLVSLGLASLLSVTLGCNPKKNEDIITDENVVSDNVFEIVEIEKPEVIEEEIISEINDVDETNVVTYAKANTNTNIYKNADKKSDKLGILFNGLSLECININDEWAEVIYDGKSAYIKTEDIDIIECIDVPNEENIPFIYSRNDLLECLNETKVAVATARVNVRSEANTNSKILNQLSKGESLEYVNDYNDEWIEVIYNGKKAYLFKEYTDIKSGYSAKNEMLDMVYMTSKTPLYDIDDNSVLTNIPRHEVAEVYGRTNDCYLVKCNGQFGYISKEHACTLGDTYVVIDISSQNLKLYVDDKLIVDTSIVTGKDTSPTYCGLFSVREKERNVYWEEFGVKVKYWMPFNRGEGMHDAKWRKKFGGDIYHEDGSHGCVNIPTKIMPTIYDNVDIGAPVLVKK